MPDDKIITEQTLDEKQLAEAEASFAEEVDEEEKEPEKVDDGEKKTVESKTEAVDDDKEDKKSKEAEGKKEPLDKTVEERLEERLKSVKDDEEEIITEEGKEIPKEKDLPLKEIQKAEPKKPFTKEFIAENLKLISDDELPDEMIIGDTTINLKEYASVYPDEWSVMKVVSATMVSKMLESINSRDEDRQKSSRDIGDRVARIEGGLAQLNFDNGVARAPNEDGSLRHPDYYEIVYGNGNKEFFDWLSKQPPKVQRLSTSLNKDDGILVLDYYKVDKAKGKVSEFDEKSKKKKKEIDDIHGYEGKKKAISRKPSLSGDTFEDPNKEAEAAFMEED